MGIFSDVLLAVDFDRTLTNRRSQIPQNNLDAIRAFTAQGGTFTVATGRSVPMFRAYHKSVPVNAPFILYNGAALYDYETQTLSQAIPIPQGAEILREVLHDYPNLWTEIQGIDYHYLFGDCPMRDEYYRVNDAPATHTDIGRLPSPLLKFAMYGEFVAPTVKSLFEDLPEEIPYIDRVTEELRQRYGAYMVIDRAAPRIIDMQAKNVSKGNAARMLAESLGKRVLVCAGDAPNDLSMLAEADLAYVPADCDPFVKRPEHITLCPCDDGAIAALIARLADDLPS